MFWKNIRKGTRKASFPSTVGGTTGSEAVAAMWKKHFEAFTSSKTSNNLCKAKSKQAQTFSQTISNINVHVESWFFQ